MNDHELGIKARLEAKGYHVYRNGLPDFLVRKGNRIFFVECKRGLDRLSRDQIAVKEALERCGLRVVIAQDDPPNHFEEAPKGFAVRPKPTTSAHVMPDGSRRLGYTPKEFAKLFGRHQVWAYRRIWSGKLRILEDAGAMLIPASEVDRFMSECETFNDIARAKRKQLNGQQSSQSAREDGEGETEDPFRDREEEEIAATCGGSQKKMAFEAGAKAILGFAAHSATSGFRSGV